MFKGSLFLLTSALAFGSYGVFSNYLERYDIFFQTYVRSFIITGILLIYGIYAKQLKKIDKKDYRWFAVILFFTSFTIAPIVYAFRYLTLGTASFLFYSSFTISTYIFGFIFFKEKLTAIKLVSLLLSVIGMLLIFVVNISPTLLLPIGLAIFNGIASSGEVTFSKKLSGKYTSVFITMLVFAIIGLSHLIISILLQEHQDIGLVTQSLPTLLLFVIVAIIGMVTVVEGFKTVEPSIGAIIGLTEIVFSALFGIILFQEQMSLQTVLGGGLIVIAAALPNLTQLLKYKQ